VAAAPRPGREGNRCIKWPRIWNTTLDIDPAEPAIASALKGVGLEPCRYVTANPVGLVAKDSLVLTGSSRTLFTSVSPPASLAVSCNSRYDGYSWSGATN